MKGTSMSMSMSTSTGTELNMKAKTAEQQQSIIAELDRQQKSAHDFIINEDQLRGDIATNPGDRRVHISIPLFDAAVISNDVRKSYPLTVGAEMQLFEKLGIPPRYGQRMRDEATPLLIENLNYWFSHPRVTSNKQRQFQIRTLDEAVRAVLSPGYLALDSFDYFFRIMRMAGPKGGIIKELTLNDKRFTMFLTQEDWAQNLTEHRGVMDKMVPGILFGNSETGDGRLRAEIKWWRQSCANGMVTEQVVARTHLGSQLPEGIISQETRKQAAALVWSEVDDMVNAAFDKDKFTAEFSRMQGLAQEVLTDPVGEVEKFAKDNSFSDDERQQIINAMMAGGDPTKWGMLNAVTLVAQHIGDGGSVERQHELERNAGQLVVVRL